METCLSLANACIRWVQQAKPTSPPAGTPGRPPHRNGKRTKGGTGRAPQTQNKHQQILSTKLNLQLGYSGQSWLPHSFHPPFPPAACRSTGIPIRTCTHETCQMHWTTRDWNEIHQYRATDHEEQVVDRQAARQAPIPGKQGKRRKLSLVIRRLPQLLVFHLAHRHDPMSLHE